MTDGKLVQSIPDIIRSKGEEPKTRTLTEEEYLDALDEKLREEVTEYLEANDLAELGDVEDVIRAILEARGSSYDEMEEQRKEKLAERGGFDDRIFLEMKSNQ